MLDGLHTSHPDYVEPYLSNLPKARRAALRRLFQAFVMEDIGGAAKRASWGNGVLRLPLPDGRRLSLEYSRRYFSGRFDAAEGASPTLEKEGSVESIEGPARLLEIFEEADLSPEGANLARFRAEVANSAANHALSMTVAEQRRRDLSALARELGAISSLSLARRLSERDASFSPLAFFEQLVADGHPLHPCAKLKVGVDAADAVRFSPESGACPEAAVVAVRKDRCREVCCDGGSFADIFFGDHPEAGLAFEEALRRRGFEPDNYAPVPVHPWQLENTLPKMHGEAMRRGEVVPLADVRVPTRALMSFRSLAPVGGGHHIKTAINVRLTNAVRTVTAASVENAAVITRMLREVRRREDFDGRLVVLEERAGAYYDPPGGEGRDILSKNLAAILREDPEEHAGPGELAMPASALLAESPLGGPVLAEIVEEFAESRAIRCVEEASVIFFRRYCEVALPGFLAMMSRYGVGLEGHLQNSVPVFRNGEPVRMLVRDFGGVRILRGRLSKRGLDVSIHPRSGILASDADDLRGKVFYPLFLNHLGELVACLCRTLDAGEGRFWKEAALVCREVYRGLEEDASIREQSAADERSLFAPAMRLKSLAAMRLLGDVTDYAYAEVPNPLARFEP